MGSHRLNFHLDDSFFEQFDSLLVHNGKVEVELLVNKLNNFAECQLSINGEVGVECDRCLDEVIVPIAYNGKLTISVSENHDDDSLPVNANDVDIIYIHLNDKEVDLSQYIYESICLSLPIQVVHSNDENGNSMCNKEMLDKLNKLLIN